MTGKLGEGRGRAALLMTTTSRKLGLIAILACSILTFTQCGIPQPYKQLIAPDPVYESSVAFFTFKKSTAVVETEFWGFELYYRFYEEGTSDIEFANTFEELATKGYRRVNSATDKVGFLPAKPLIPVSLNDRDDIFTVTVDFTAITAPDPTITATETDNAVPVPLDDPINIEDFRRGVADEAPDEYEQFSDFVDTDDDISALDWSSFEIKGKLVLYVLSYGKNVLTNTDLYSEPVWLGEITHDFVP